MSGDRVRGVPGLPGAWGITPAEWQRRYACDEQAGAGWVRLLRGVDCAAPPERLWPWLAMLRVAPYSYDLVDNLGRRSPRTLDPSMAKNLAVGQRLCIIFTLDSFTPGRELTLRVRSSGPSQVFGRLFMTYAVLPADGGGSRLVGVLRHPAHRGVGQVVDTALAWGDLVMMRRQLLTLAELAATA